MKRALGWVFDEGNGLIIELLFYFLPLPPVKCGTHSLIQQEELKNCSADEITRRNRESTELFIARSIEVHKKKYDYSHTQFVKNGGRVIIDCRKQGPFLQQPRIHLKGWGCKKCRKYSNRDGSVGNIQSILFSRINFKSIDWKHIERTQHEN